MLVTVNGTWTIWDALLEAEVSNHCSRRCVRNGVAGLLQWHPPLTDEQIEQVLNKFYGGRPQVTVEEVRQYH